MKKTRSGGGRFPEALNRTAPGKSNILDSPVSSTEMAIDAESARNMAELHLRHMNSVLLQALDMSGDREPEDDFSLGVSGALWRLLLEKAGEPGVPAGEAPVKTGGDSPAVPASSSWPSGRNLDAIITRTAREHRLDPNLVKAVIRAESGFDASAISSAGAMGLMQLMPATARDLAVNNPFDPGENIRGGCRYLRLMLDRYQGNLDQALAAYNWGPGNVERAGGRLPAETRAYVGRVNRFYRELSGAEET